MVEEPYLIDWMDSKTMPLADILGRRLVYEADDGMSCDIEQDILPVGGSGGRVRDARRAEGGCGRQTTADATAGMNHTDNLAENG